jgi:hypothetical protein
MFRWPVAVWIVFSANATTEYFAGIQFGTLCVQRNKEAGAAARRTSLSVQEKLRLGNLRSMNVFLDVDFWVPRIRRLAEI